MKLTIKVWQDGDYSYVSVNDVRLNPKPSQAIVNHSPDGFAWGYGGSGPHQTALAILLQAAGRQYAVQNYHQFVTDHVSKWDWPKGGEYEVEVKL